MESCVVVVVFCCCCFLLLFFFQVSITFLCSLASGACIMPYTVVYEEIPQHRVDIHEMYRHVVSLSRRPPLHPSWTNGMIRAALMYCACPDMYSTQYSVVPSPHLNSACD